MTAADADRPVELGAAAQRTATEVQQLTAALTLLRSRVESLEQQQLGAGAARNELAVRLESLGSDLSRLRRLEDAVVAVRNDVAGLLDERSASLQADMTRLHRDHDRVAGEAVRRTEELAARVHHVEDLVGRDESGARLEVLRTEVGALARRLEGFEGRAGELERRPPRVAPAVKARIDDLDDAVAAIRRDMTEWHHRVEEQSETVRESKIVSGEMRAEAERIREAHHAAAEAQRLSEARMEEALAEIREAIDTRWERFLTEREHRWSAATAGDAERDEVAAGLGERIGDLAALVDTWTKRLAEDVDSRAEETRGLRESVRSALENLAAAVTEGIAVVETGVPYEERSDVIEERQLAIRRALRARRRSSPDG